MTERRRIAVAMSGGVDSSVAACLLHEAGEDIFGLMLRLQDQVNGKPNRCCTPDDVGTARALASHLDIPFHVLDARQAFEQGVIQPFVSGYAQGLTPNPCIECNRSIRFGFLLEHALAFGATHLATGHYARISQTTPPCLLTARDASKDQSYVLHMLTQAQLARILLPLGERTKQEVREYAHSRGLAVADRAESQDLCFARGDYRAVLERHAVQAAPGPIFDRDGKVLGTHSGLAGYTLGQRKGIGVAAQEALYVIDKDLERNALIVGGRARVGRQRFRVSRLNWIAGAPPAAQFAASVQVRYHAPRALGRIRCLSSTEAEIELEARNPDVAPGQAAVVYQDDVCLGGGIIRL